MAPRRHVRGEKHGDEKKAPQLFPVVSRYRRNIQVWEKTYPGCRRVGSGHSRGAEDQNKFPTAGKGEAGRPAAAPGNPGGASPVLREGKNPFKFRFGASFTPILSTANPPPRPDRKRCLPPWTNPPPSTPSRNNPARVGQVLAGGLRGGGKRGGEGRQAAPSSLPGALSLFFSFSACRSILPEVNSTVKASSSSFKGSCERESQTPSPEEAAAAAAASFSRSSRFRAEPASRAEGGGAMEGGCRWLGRGWA